MTKRSIALITGASRGIGRQIALTLAAQNWDIAFNYLASEEQAALVAAAIQTAGGRAEPFRCDVADTAAVKAWIEQVDDAFGNLDLVINCAGITRDNPLVLMSDHDWNAVIDTNLSGVFNVCRAAALPMLKRRQGCIVNISSVAGVYGNATQTNYSAAKAGIIGFSKALAKEVGPYGIRVNVVAPGLIDTDMTAKLDAARLDRMVANVPLKRMGTAAEVAGVVAFLASPAAAYVTGQVIGVDGGLVL